MNRLWVRFTLAFIAITQLSLFVVTVLADMGISTEFQQYVVFRTTSDMDQASLRQGFMSQPPESIAVAGNGVAEGGIFGSTSASSTVAGAVAVTDGISPLTVLQPNAQTISIAGNTFTTGFMTIGSVTSSPIISGSVTGNLVASDSLPAPQPVPLPDSSQPFLLTAPKGMVIYDRQGTALSGSERTSAVPVNTSDGSNALPDYTFSDFPPQSTASMLMQSPEQQFLVRLRTTLLIAALTVGLIGVLLGLILSRTMTAPLANLTRAAHAFARRDWSYRVKTRGASEIAAVARAFNEMADEIQRSENLRRNMIADIAHELRTPLSVMQGNLRALLDGVYPLDRSEIATLYQETTMLSRLIDDLRELTHADSGQLDLHMTALDLREMLGAAIANFSIAAESQNVRVTLDCAPDLPCARADVDRVNQVLRNLLANALRHTPDGRVTVSARVSPDKAVCISVEDSGEGIAPEDLPRVFDRFYRADKSRARTTGSSGLGLPIAKAWVEAMGGTIGAESTYGAGSRFWFTLPVG